MPTFDSSSISLPCPAEDTTPTQQNAAGRREVNWSQATLVFVALTSLARLWLLPRLELAPDEAYYWDWSRYLDLGYYDQGPLIAYLIRITTMLFGTNEFGVRIGVWLAALGTLGCAWTLARRLYSAHTGFLTVLVLALTPFFTLGSLTATYDGPLVFFWALTLVFLERAFFASDTRVQQRAWILAGLAGGLGLLSKHTMALLLPCLGLFLLLVPARRGCLRRLEPYIALLLALFCYTGVLWWNAQHHWWTFGHLLFLTKKGDAAPLRHLGEFLGSQAILLGPGLLIGCLTVFRRIGSPADVSERLTEEKLDSSLYGQDMFVRDAAERNEHRQDSSLLLERDKYLFLTCFGLPIFGFFCVLAFKTKVQGNWAPCAWLTPTILLAASLARQSEKRGRGARLALGKTALIGATSGLLTLLMLSATLRYRLGLRLSAKADLTNTAYGWRRMARQADQLRSEMQQSGHPVFLAANDYQTCALLAFYLPNHPHTVDLFLGSRLNMYAAHLDGLQQHLGEDALFVNGGQEPDPDLRGIFARVEWQAPLSVWRKPYFEQPVRVLHFARCYNYLHFTGTNGAWGG